MSFRAFSSIAALIAGSSPAVVQAKLQVVATVPDLAAIVQEIGGDAVEVTVLSSPSQDPHYVDARPSSMLPLNRADLLIAVGLGLEQGWLPPLQINARNPKIQVGGEGWLDASQVVDKREVVAADRSKGDIHPGGNPHYLFDPRQAVRVARAIATRLAALDPEGAAAYEAGFAKFASEVDAVAGELRARSLALPAERRRVVVFHASMTYLEDWLGLEQVATVEPLPGVPPNPGHVAKVLGTIRHTKARVILQEEFYPREPSGTLAKLSGARLVVVPGGTRASEGERYADHVRKIAELIHAALSD